MKRKRERDGDTKEQEVNRIKIEGNAVCLPSPFLSLSLSLYLSPFSAVCRLLSARLCASSLTMIFNMSQLSVATCAICRPGLSSWASATTYPKLPLPLSIPPQWYLFLSQWLCSWNECRVNALADVASYNGRRMDMTSIALATTLSHTQTVACKPIPIRQGCNMYLC